MTGVASEQYGWIECTLNGTKVIVGGPYDDLVGVSPEGVMAAYSPQCILVNDELLAQLEPPTYMLVTETKEMDDDTS